MNFLRTLSIALGALLCLSTASQGADLRIKVVNKGIATKRTDDTRSTKRHLKITVDNRDREAYEGATLEWKVIARNIQNRKLSIAGSGTKKIDIPADEKTEFTSGTYSFSKTEGKVEVIEENRNRPDRQQFKVDPDSGTRYAGYIITIKKDGEVLAESATAGMKKRVRGLTSPKKKK